MRVIKPLLPDDTTLLFELGPRKLVLLEGESDLRVFEEWYKERLGDVMFHVPGGGSIGVKRRLQELLDLSEHKQVYAVIDRDFRPETEVEACLAATNGNLFILRRYAIENYLMEPKALQEELRVYYGSTFVVPTVTEMTEELLQLFGNLKTIMAANWVLRDAEREYFPEGHSCEPRQLIVQLAAVKLECSDDEAETLIAQKEVIIDPTLVDVEICHTYVNGKFALSQFCQHQRKILGHFPEKSYLFRLLVRTVKAHGIHQDIRFLIEERILTLGRQI